MHNVGASTDSMPERNVDSCDGASKLGTWVSEAAQLTVTVEEWFRSSCGVVRDQRAAGPVGGGGASCSPSDSTSEAGCCTGHGGAAIWSVYDHDNDGKAPIGGKRNRKRHDQQRHTTADRSQGGEIQEASDNFFICLAKKRRVESVHREQHRGVCITRDLTKT